jgi:hypothetical protein
VKVWKPTITQELIHRMLRYAMALKAILDMVIKVIPEIFGFDSPLLLIV